jgi:acyl dehydratase
MRTLFRLVASAALFGALAVGAASAASTTPTIVPTFTVSVTVPTTIARGQLTTATASITNLTQADAVAHVSWRLVAPKVTTMFGILRGQFSTPVAAGATVSKDVSFKVPIKWPAGNYTLTVSVAGAAAPAIATIAVT